MWRHVAVAVAVVTTFGLPASGAELATALAEGAALADDTALGCAVTLGTALATVLAEGTAICEEGTVCFGAVSSWHAATANAITAARPRRPARTGSRRSRESADSQKGHCVESAL